MRGRGVGVEKEPGVGAGGSLQGGVRQVPRSRADCLVSWPQQTGMFLGHTVVSTCEQGVAKSRAATASWLLGKTPLRARWTQLLNVQLPSWPPF